MTNLLALPWLCLDEPPLVRRDTYDTLQPVLCFANSSLSLLLKA